MVRNEFRPFVNSFYASAAKEGLQEPHSYSDFRLDPKMLIGIRRPLSMDGANFGQQPLFPSDQPESGNLGEPEAFRQIMRQFSKANVKSDQYGRYYMSLLCTVVSSSDFSRIVSLRSRLRITCQRTSASLPIRLASQPPKDED